MDVLRRRLHRGRAAAGAARGRQPGAPPARRTRSRDAARPPERRGRRGLDGPRGRPGDAALRRRAVAPADRRRAGGVRAPSRVIRSAHRLTDPEQVALAVAEPGAALAASVLARVVALDVGDRVDRAEPGRVDLLEDDAAGPQLGDGRLDVVDLPAHLREGARGGAGRLEEGEVARGGAVQEPARALVDRLEAELLRVEAAGAGEVLGGKARGGASVLQHVPIMTRRIAEVLLAASLATVPAAAIAADGS